MVGSPISVSDWLDALERDGIRVFDLSRHDRLGYVQQFCDLAMSRIGALVPVTPVSLACAALQTFSADFVSRVALLARMQELREVLPEVNARVLQARPGHRDHLRASVSHAPNAEGSRAPGEGFLILSRGRPLISYYANAIAHFSAVRRRGAGAGRASRPRGDRRVVIAHEGADPFRG